MSIRHIMGMAIIDENFRRKLVESPKEVLIEEGIDILEFDFDKLATLLTGKLSKTLRNEKIAFANMVLMDRSR